MAVLAVALIGGCYRRVEVATTPCDALGKTTDPATKADLEKRCGHGGPEFKPTPPKAY
jgi:entry exclusion lipoprotein TrbK